LNFCKKKNESVQFNFVRFSCCANEDILWIPKKLKSLPIISLKEGEDKKIKWIVRDRQGFLLKSIRILEDFEKCSLENE